MIAARYVKTFGTSLFNRRGYTATSMLLRNVASISKAASTEALTSCHRRCGNPSSFSSRIVVDEKDVNHCTWDSIHSRNDILIEKYQNVELPQYLRRHYWWAYINPTMISILDRKWLVDIVLWGNFTRLRDAAVEELRKTPESKSAPDAATSCFGGTKIQGKVLQISAVYANLTETIVESLAPDSTLDVIDVVPAQLSNLQRKLQRRFSGSDQETLQKVSLRCCDASNLRMHFPDNNKFDKVLIFFLLHETPTEVREKVLAEACRAVKPNGKIVIIDYHKPNTAFWYGVMQFMYYIYEPFAMDLWKHPLSHWLPSTNNDKMIVNKETFFGGLYQKLVIQTGSNSP